MYDQLHARGVVPAVETHRVRQIHFGAGERQQLRGIAEAEANRFGIGRPVGDAQSQVLTIAHHPCRHGRQPPCRQDGLAIAHPKRRQARQLLAERCGDHGQGNLGIDMEGGNEIRWGQSRRGDLTETLGKFTDALSTDGQPRRHGVAAETIEQVGALRQRLDEVESLNAARRALRRPVLHGHEDHRPVVAFHELRGHDADHAGVPPLTGQHDGRSLLEP